MAKDNGMINLEEEYIIGERDAKIEKDRAALGGRSVNRTDCPMTVNKKG